MINPLEQDLREMVASTDETIWSQLKNKKIFLTGGTGFFGSWLLESLVFANESLQLNLEVLVVSRDPARFQKKAPHLFQAKIISFLKSDIRHFVYPEKKYDYIIHAATDASESLNRENPLEMMDTILGGTRHVLEFARDTGIKRMLFISSGAVYGKQPAEVLHVNEDSQLGPDFLEPKNAYAESKRLAELMCAVYASKYDIQIPIARCFAFVGPYLDINIHFAIGNFIRNGLLGENIEIKGDGTPLRSYLYGSDLVVWLLTILVNGETRRAYNVGSDESLSIGQLAKTIQECFPQKPDLIVRQKADPSKPREVYVPSIERATKELGLSVRVKLKEAIERTIRWHGHRHGLR